jgi:hypothetical protein
MVNRQSSEYARQVWKRVVDCMAIAMMPLDGEMSKNELYHRLCFSIDMLDLELKSVFFHLLHITTNVIFVRFDGALILE